MKSFYGALDERAAQMSVVGVRNVEVAVGYAPETDFSAHTHIGARARIAVYDAPSSAPRIEDIESAPVAEYIEALTTRVYTLAHEQGGTIPYTAIREVTENFIHADFLEPVVSILDSGMTIRFADQGPGISDKQRAVLPGFTTANGEMKRYIRGVGSGLPIVREFLAYSGGSLTIEDNLGCGSVVTMYMKPQEAARNAGVFAQLPVESDHEILAKDLSGDWVVGRHVGTDVPVPSGPRLTTRQKQVLALVMESGSAGPSLVAKELGVGVSTAYRDLALLEDLGLIASDGGKRTLTEQGLVSIDNLTSR